MFEQLVFESNGVDAMLEGLWKRRLALLTNKLPKPQPATVAVFFAPDGAIDRHALMQFRAQVMAKNSHTVLVVSGRDDAESARVALTAGALAYCSQPMNGDAIDIALSSALRLAEHSVTAANIEPSPYRDARKRFERGYLDLMLRVTGGNVALTARLAGCSRKKLYAMCRQVALDPGIYRLRTLSQ